VIVAIGDIVESGRRMGSALGWSGSPSSLQGRLFSMGPALEEYSAPPSSLGAFTSSSFAVDLQFMKEITLECNSRWTIRIRKDFKIVKLDSDYSWGWKWGIGSIPSFQRDEYLRLSFSRDLSIEETKEGMDSFVREFRLATPIPDWKDGNAHFSL